MMSDGSLIGRSAAMCCDYHDAPGNSGLPQHEPEQIRRYIVEAHRCGRQIATHAIGDAALDVVLDAYEEAQRLHPRTDVRHRVERSGDQRRAGRPAHAVHEEHIKGPWPGGRSPISRCSATTCWGVAPERIGRLTVGATVVGGRIAHDTGALTVS